jgi:hypothetical protein
MTSRPALFALAALYVASVVSLALGRTGLALALVLTFLAIDKAGRSLRHANAALATLLGATARHAADPNERKESK